MVKIYFLLLFPASIGLLCVSKQAMSVFGEIYIPWYPVMAAFAVYMLTLGVQGIISNQIIYLYRQENEDVKIFFICGVFNVAVNFILVFCNMLTPANSMMVTMAANILVIIMEYRVIKNKLKLDIKLFRFDNMKYFYYSLLFLPISFVMNKCVESNIISCAINIVLCGLVYLSILLWTKDETFFEVYDRFFSKFIGFIKRKI